MPFLLTRILGFFSDEKGFQNLIKRINSYVYMLIMIGYFLSPCYIIPELIFGVIGLLDDIMIFMMIFCVVSLYYLSENCWMRLKRITIFAEGNTPGN